MHVYVGKTVVKHTVRIPIRDVSRRMKYRLFSELLSQSDRAKWNEKKLTDCWMFIFRTVWGLFAYTDCLSHQTD